VICRASIFLQWVANDAGGVVPGDLEDAI